MAKNKNKPAGNQGRDWIIRIVIFGALGIFLVLALLDHNAKKEYTQTGQSWARMVHEGNLANKLETRLPLADMEKTIVGSPEVTKTDDQILYTWKGIFRDYTVTLTLDPFDDVIVKDVLGPPYEPEE